LVRIVSETPVRIPVDGAVRVQIEAPANALAGRVELELSEPPEGVVIQKVTLSRSGVEIVLQSDPAKVKPGLKGNLIVNVFGARPPASGNEKAQGNRRRTPVSALPAIPFEIAEP
jgi:hypothetical protein